MAVTLYEYLRTFMTISCPLLRRRAVSEESCRENENTRFLANIIFRKSYYQIM